MIFTENEKFLAKELHFKLRFYRIFLVHPLCEDYSNNIITRDVIKITDIIIPRKTLNAYT